jgi:hypothetical protein
MLKRKLALGVICGFTLSGLVACGGGGSSEPASQGNATAPNPAPAPIPTPVPPATSTIEFSSGTYVRENQGTISDAVVVGDTMYYVSFDAVGTMWSRIDKVKDYVVADKIVDAPALYQLADQTSFNSGQFDATLTINDDKVISSMTGLTLSMGNSFFLNGNRFNPVENIADISKLNGQWISSDFRSIQIDSNTTLSAVDANNCQISGTLAAKSNHVFAATLTYSDCDKAGSYEGALWSYSFNDVTYLKWFALDNGNKAVSASLDTIASEQEQLALTSKLNPVLYAGFAGKALFTKGNKIYYLGGSMGGSYFFEYQAPTDVTTLIATGKGITWPINAGVNASLKLIVPKLAGQAIEGEITYDNAGSESFSNLQPLPKQSLLSSVTGNWGELIITDSGSLSGKLVDCTVVSGTVSGYESSIADIAVELTSCDGAGSYSGVVTALDQEQDRLMLFIHRNSSADASIRIISGGVSRTN